MVGGRRSGGTLGGHKCSENEKKNPEKSGMATGSVFSLINHTSMWDGYSGLVSDCSTVGSSGHELAKFGQIRFFWPKWSKFSKLNYEKNICCRY